MSKDKFRAIWNSRADDLRHKMLELKDSAYSNLPVSLWEKNMFFKGAKDSDLLTLTGAFPGRIQEFGTTHPVFVLKMISNIGFRLCPCTSKPHKAMPYVQKGCVLDKTQKTINKDSYILKLFDFNISKNNNILKDLNFIGKVPSACIKGATCG